MKHTTRKTSEEEQSPSMCLVLCVHFMHSSSFLLKSGDSDDSAEVE